jgi:hypothetical protein
MYAFRVVMRFVVEFAVGVYAALIQCYVPLLLISNVFFPFFLPEIFVFFFVLVLSLPRTLELVCQAQRPETG